MDLEFNEDTNVSVNTYIMLVGAVAEDCGAYAYEGGAGCLPTVRAIMRATSPTSSVSTAISANIQRIFIN